MNAVASKFIKRSLIALQTLLLTSVKKRQVQIINRKRKQI